MTEPAWNRWIGAGLLLLSTGLFIVDIRLSGWAQKVFHFGIGAVTGASFVLLLTGRSLFLSGEELSARSATQ